MVIFFILFLFGQIFSIREGEFLDSTTAFGTRCRSFRRVLWRQNWGRSGLRVCLRQSRTQDLCDLGGANRISRGQTISNGQLFFPLADPLFQLRKRLVKGFSWLSRSFLIQLVYLEYQRVSLIVFGLQHIMCVKRRCFSLFIVFLRNWQRY